MKKSRENYRKEMLNESEELLGAPAAAPDPGPPAWLKTLLDHQTQQLQQLVMPILHHATVERGSTTGAVLSNLGGTVPPQSSSQGTQEYLSAQTDAPFAAEVEVSRQRSYSAGPSNILNLHDPAVRHGEEWMPPHDAHGTSGNSRNRQDMERQLPNEACKVKLAMYNSTEDWDVLFFEHHARKYGWTGYTLLKERLTQRFGVKRFLYNCLQEAGRAASRKR